MHFLLHTQSHGRGAGLRVQHFAQGHVNMQTVEVEISSTDLLRNDLLYLLIHNPSFIYKKRNIHLRTASILVPFNHYLQ